MTKKKIIFLTIPAVLILGLGLLFWSRYGFSPKTRFEHCLKDCYGIALPQSAKQDCLDKCTQAHKFVPTPEELDIIIARIENENNNENLNADQTANVNAAINTNQQTNTNTALNLNVPIDNNGNLNANIPVNTNVSVNTNASLNTNVSVNTNSQNNTNNSVNLNVSTNTNNNANTNASVDPLAYSRDMIRLTHIRNIQTALTSYMAMNDHYPDSLEVVANYFYQSKVPENPTPGGMAYEYSPSADSYALKYKLEVGSDEISAGVHTAGPSNIE